MVASSLVKLADRLTPTQQHVMLRCSEAERWDRSGYGMARSWPDVVYGRRHTSMQTVRALVRMGLARADDEGVSLTRLGLSVQLELRMRRVPRRSA
jgi:hypothetical protein